VRSRIRGFRGNAGAEILDLVGNWGYDMSDIDHDLHTRNATAYFETRAAADAAVNDLVAAGIARDQISVAGTGAFGTTPTSGDRSFWEELKDLFLPAEDRYAYAEGLRRGGVLVSVRTEQSDYERVLEILDRDGAVDLDKQEASWREEGWTGYPGEGAAAPTAASVASQRDLGAGSSSETAGSPRSGTTSAAGADEVVPVYEEQLRVGKRDVSHGRVRIRSYVVETPVNVQVRLHSESVQVERKPVDRPIAAGDALFQDRVIEAEERAEEAVVGKETRVKEELTLRKTAADRTQDISDFRVPNGIVHRTASRLGPSTTWTGQTKSSSPRAHLLMAGITTSR
jgi:uncharacterized protein (TIGR02271 family)